MEFQAIELLKIDQIQKLIPKLRILKFTHNQIVFVKIKSKLTKVVPNSELVVGSAEEEIRFKKHFLVN